MSDDPIMRMNEICQRTGLCSSTVYKWMKQGRFPRSVQLTDNPRGAVGWKRAEVEAWIERQKPTPKPEPSKALAPRAKGGGLNIGELDPARDRGRPVLYTTPYGSQERGRISSWNGDWVFVRYRKGATPKATPAAHLDFADAREGAHG